MEPRGLKPDALRKRRGGIGKFNAGVGMQKLGRWPVVVLCVATAATLFGCGGEIVNGNGDEVPEVTGTYEGLLQGLGEKADGSGYAQVGQCGVTNSLDAQSGTDVSGSFQLGSQCGSLSGEVNATLCETIRCTDDRAPIDLNLSTEGTNAVESLTGCSITSGDGAFTGTLRGGAMDARSEFTAACPDDSGGTFTVTWAIILKAGETS